MEEIHIEKTYSTPSVRFILASQTLELEGKLIPENADVVFAPIMSWIEKYFQSEKAELTLCFRLYYYNTSASKRLYHLCRKMDDFFKLGRKIKIRWEYEEGDEDSCLDAQDFLNSTTLPHDIVEIPE